MPPNEMAVALAELRRQSEQLWAVSNRIVATDCALEVRSTAATINAVAGQIEAALTERAGGGPSQPEQMHDRLLREMP